MVENSHIILRWTKLRYSTLIRYYSLNSPLKIQLCGYLTKKKHFHLMRKNPHDRILKGKPKKQYINIVHKSCSFKKSLELIFITLIYYFHFSLNKKKIVNFFCALHESTTSFINSTTENMGLIFTKYDATVVMKLINFDT